jgi:putative inorganic carbon (hco3(-)) transporter
VSFWFFYAYLFLFLFRPFDFNESLRAQFDAIPIMPMLLAMAAASCFLERRPDKFAPQVFIAPIVLLVFSISTALQGWFGGAVDVFRTNGVQIIQLIVASLAIRSEKHLRRVFSLMVYMGVAFSVHGLQQIETGEGFSGQKILEYSGFSRIRYVGVLADPNDLGLYFLIILPMAYYLMSNSKNYFFKLVMLSCVGVVLVGIYYTNSRGTTVALAGMLGAMLLLRRNFKTMAFAMVVGAAALAFGPSRVAEIELGEESAWARVEAWYTGIQILRDAPLFGIGRGGFADRFTLVAHNSFVQVLAELGIIGYTFWIALVYLCLRVTFRPNLFAKGTRKMDAPGALFLALTGFLMAGFFITRSLESQLFIILGMCTAVYQFMPATVETKPIDMPTLAKHAAALTVASVIGIIILTKLAHFFR